MESKGDGRVDVPAKILKRKGTEDSNQADTWSIILRKPKIEQLVAESFRPSVREVVEEVIERQLLHLRPIINRTTGTSFRLVFKNELPATVFTNSKIKAKDDKPIEIALYDVTSNSIVTLGPLSSIKIEICVLDGDFGNEDWTANEFIKAKIIHQRSNKGHFLKGDAIITLTDGVGYISNKLVFTDSSKRTRTRRLRLGVKAVLSTSNRTSIKEGISAPFMVKHSRGVAIKKHSRPSLNDEVWNLQQITQKSVLCEDLSSIGIITVKDLLQADITKEDSLQEIIGKIPKKKWDKIIKHAKACDMDDNERYSYQGLIAEQSISLLFNCIYEVVQVSFNGGQSYCSLESLNLDQKQWVEIVKQQAYTNVKDHLVPLENTTNSLMETLFADGALLQPFDSQVAHQQGQPEMCQNLYHENGWPVSVSHIDEMAMSSHSPCLLDQVMNFVCISSGDGAEPSNHSSFLDTAVHISSKPKCKTVWYKIRNAFKWLIPHISNQRKAKLFLPQF